MMEYIVAVSCRKWMLWLRGQEKVVGNFIAARTTLSVTHMLLFSSAYLRVTSQSRDLRRAMIGIWQNTICDVSWL